MSQARFSFEFHDWQQAFAEFYRRKAEDPKTVFVVSRAEYVSGYWIEEASEDDGASADETVYTDVAAVKALEAQIRRSIAEKPSLSLGGVLT